MRNLTAKGVIRRPEKRRGIGKRRGAKRITSGFIFGPDWSYAEFRRENLRAGCKVRMADYRRLKKAIKRRKPEPVPVYNRAHGPLSGLIRKKHGIVHWSVMAPGELI